MEGFPTCDKSVWGKGNKQPRRTCARDWKIAYGKPFHWRTKKGGGV